MTRPGEYVLRGYLKRHMHAGRAARDARHGSSDQTPEDYVDHQYATTARILARYPRFDVRGKDVLELGCGLGGRAAYIAGLGPRHVLGVDINREEIDAGKRICADKYPELNDKLSLECVSEDQSWGKGSFDVIVLIDAIEHVVSPVSIVRRAYDCLRPGGILYLQHRLVQRLRLAHGAVPLRECAVQRPVDPECHALADQPAVVPAHPA